MRASRAALLVVLPLLMIGLLVGWLISHSAASIPANGGVYLADAAPGKGEKTLSSAQPTSSPEAATGTDELISQLGALTTAGRTKLGTPDNFSGYNNFYNKKSKDNFLAAEALLAKARQQWKDINRASLSVHYHGVHDDSGAASPDRTAEIEFQRPFKYIETGKGPDPFKYQYVTDGVFEVSDQLGHTGLVPIDTDSNTFVDRFPLGILRSDERFVVTEDALRETSGSPIATVSSWISDISIITSTGEITSVEFFSRRNRSRLLVEITNFKYMDRPVTVVGSDGQQRTENRRLPVSYRYAWPTDHFTWDAQVDYKQFNAPDARDLSHLRLLLDENR